MIIDYTCGSAIVQACDVAPTEVDSSACRLADVRFVMRSIESMRRANLMRFGSSSESQWWTDGYEADRRKALEDT